MRARRVPRASASLSGAQSVSGHILSDNRCSISVVDDARSSGNLAQRDCFGTSGAHGDRQPRSTYGWAVRLRRRSQAIVPTASPAKTGSGWKSRSAPADAPERGSLPGPFSDGSPEPMPACWSRAKCSRVLSKAILQRYEVASFCAASSAAWSLRYRAIRATAPPCALDDPFAVCEFPLVGATLRGKMAPLRKSARGRSSNVHTVLVTAA